MGPEVAPDADTKGSKAKLGPNPSSTLLFGNPKGPTWTYSPVGLLRARARLRSAGEKQADLEDSLKAGRPWKHGPVSVQTATVPKNLDFIGLASLRLSPQSDRRIADHLLEKLTARTNQYNLTWSQQGPDAPVVEFLVAAAEAAQQLYSSFFRQLAEQVTTRCEEHGVLLHAIWEGQTSVLEGILQRIRDQACNFRDRLEDLEGQMDIKESRLQEEIDGLKAQVRKLQAVGPGDRLSVRKSLMPSDLANILGAVGGGRSSAPQRSTVVRFQTAEPEKEEDHEDSVRSEPERVGRVIKFEEAPSQMQPTAAPAANPRRPSVADGLKSGNRRASVAAGNLLKQLQAAGEEAEAMEDGDQDELQAKTAGLKRQLEDCRVELFQVYDQIAQLEAVADQAVALESRAEAAENERDDALEKARLFTPRPAPAFRSLSDPALNEAAAAVLTEAVEAYRQWPALELASMLVGEATGGGQSAMQAAPFAFGCLNAAVLDDELTRAGLLEALQVGVVKPLAGWLTQQQLAWLEQHVEGLPPAHDAEALATFLTGISKAGFEYPAEHYGCLLIAQQGLAVGRVADIIKVAGKPTVERVAALEEENRKLRDEVQAFRAAAAAQAEMEARAENRQLRDEESKLEKPNPLEVYLDLLAASEEASIKEGLMGMGTAADVPKLFRAIGRVRNKQMSKRETEKMVKEIWKDKLHEMRAGKQTDLVDFVFQHLHKRVGIVTAVVEMGYNLLYSVWKYSFDADCNLFLKVLKGDIKEEVYLQQITLQEDLDLLFCTLDRTVHAVETGTIPKADVAASLEVYMRVGEPGHKTKERFDALLQALDADQPGPVVSYKKLFVEDRDYNQGEFAESVREQFLEERVEYFREVQRLLYVVALNQEAATKPQLVKALCMADPNLGDKQAWSRANEVFSPGAEQHSIKLLMKRLQAGAGKRDRTSSAKLSVLSKPDKTLQRPKVKVSSAILEAVEAVRVKMAVGKFGKPLHATKSAAPELFMQHTAAEADDHGGSVGAKMGRDRGLSRMAPLRPTTTL